MLPAVIMFYTCLYFTQKSRADPIIYMNNNISFLK